MNEISVQIAEGTKMKKIEGKGRELYFNQYCICSYVSRTTLATGASVVQRIKALLVDCYNCQVYTNSAATVR